MGEEVVKRKDWERRRGRLQTKERKNKKYSHFLLLRSYFQIVKPLFEQDIIEMSAILTFLFPSMYSKSIWAQKEMQPMHLKGKKTEQCRHGVTD